MEVRYFVITDFVSVFDSPLHCISGTGVRINIGGILGALAGNNNNGGNNNNTPRPPNNNDPIGSFLNGFGQAIENSGVELQLGPNGQIGLGSRPPNRELSI